MPIKIKDDAGVEHEVFTQADLEAKIEEATTTIRAELKPEEKPAAAAVVKPAADGDMPAWAKEMNDKIAALGGTVSSSVKGTYIGKVAGSLDADKQKDVSAKFDNLTGYADTQEGQEQRAKDAYLLVTGERFDGGGINMGNINGAQMGNTNVSNQTQNTEKDKEIQEALGVKPEDVTKFGPKQ